MVGLAGYKDRMEQFFESNAGMGSRIAHHIDFPDYSIGELTQIAELMIAEQGYEFLSRRGRGVRRLPRAPYAPTPIRQRTRRP